jgi:hypothetical protein
VAFSEGVIDLAVGKAQDYLPTFTSPRERNGRRKLAEKRFSP